MVLSDPQHHKGSANAHGRYSPGLIDRERGAVHLELCQPERPTLTTDHVIRQGDNANDLVTVIGGVTNQYGSSAKATTSIAVSSPSLSVRYGPGMDPFLGVTAGSLPSA